MANRAQALEAYLQLRTLQAESKATARQLALMEILEKALTTEVSLNFILGEVRPDDLPGDSRSTLSGGYTIIRPKAMEEAEKRNANRPNG